MQIDAVRAALLDALSVVLPVDCAGCSAPDRALCGRCRAELRPRCRRGTLDGLPVVAALDYEGVPRRVLLAVKDGDRPGLARALAPAFAEAVRGAASGTTGPVALVPVPSTGRARRRRGYAPVELLVRAVALRPARVLVAPARPRAAAQKRLGRAERARNVEAAFRARGALAGRRVLVVDDVATTGATLRAAVRALREAGAEVVGAAVLARTPRRVGRADEASGELSWTS